MKSFMINDNISDFRTIYKDQCVLLDDGSIVTIKNIYKSNSKFKNW